MVEQETGDRRNAESKKHQVILLYSKLFFESFMLSTDCCLLTTYL
jgi:hypothetical protein